MFVKNAWPHGVIGRYRHRHRSISSSGSIVIGIDCYRHRHRSLSSSPSVSIVIVIGIDCYRHRNRCLSSSASVVIVIDIGRYRHRHRLLSSSVSIVIVIGIHCYRHRYRLLSSSVLIVIVIGIHCYRHRYRLLSSQVSFVIVIRIDCSVFVLRFRSLLSLVVTVCFHHCWRLKYLHRRRHCQLHKPTSEHLPLAIPIRFWLLTMICRFKHLPIRCKIISLPRYRAKLSPNAQLHLRLLAVLKSRGKLGNTRNDSKVTCRSRII